MKEKESKSERIERIKREKDGLDVLNDIYRYAKEKSVVEDEDIDRLKWYGLYTQNRNLQPKSDNNQYFMLRVKVKRAILDKEQIKTLAEISKKYAKGTADFTTRQDIQLHWIKIKDIPEIFSALEKVGLTTRMAAGDVVRNIVTCPLSAKSKEELIDVSEIAEELNSLFDANKEFSNLPRKFKIGVSGCGIHCMPHEIQDLSFVACKSEKGDVKFAVFVGGGLASNRRFADFLGYIEKDSIATVAKAVVEIFRDFGNRKKRNRARLGHLIKEWGVEKFKNRLEEVSKIDIKPGKNPSVTEPSKRFHHKIESSKKENFFHIGASLVAGRFNEKKLTHLYNIMKKYHINQIATTTNQNFILLDIKRENIENIKKELIKIDAFVENSNFRVKSVACTGLDFCKYAISETKSVAQRIVMELEESFSSFNETVQISVNGCPNSCAHPQIVDIGLSGATFQRDGKKVQGFEILLGGYLNGSDSKLAKKSKIFVTDKEAPLKVREIIKEYKRSKYDSFKEFIKDYLPNN